MSTPINAAAVFEYRLLIVHPDRPAEQLLFEDPKRRGLPQFISGEPHFWQTVGHINQTISTRYKLDTTVLRLLTSHPDEKNNVTRRFYALELAGSSPRLPPELHWGNADALEAAADRRAWQLWRDWITSPGKQQVPWYIPGWLAAMNQRIAAALNEIGCRPTGPIEQIRSWERSAILRLPTDHGVLYFKQVPPMFAAELRLSDALRQQFPEHIPQSLLVDYDQRWSIMPDLGDRSLHQLGDVERWQAALRQFGRLQRQMASHLPELRQAGIAERPLARLPVGFKGLLAGGWRAVSADRVRLSEAQFGELQALAPQINADVARLAAFELPPSIEHGDFWGGQILTAGDQFHFIDWSDSSISHPFFSITFLAEAEGLPPELSEARLLLRDAYLSAWEGATSVTNLRQAFHIAQRLGPLHHALIYHQTILPQMAVRDEMHNMVPFYLLYLLSGYEEQAPS